MTKVAKLRPVVESTMHKGQSKLPSLFLFHNLHNILVLDAVGQADLLRLVLGAGAPNKSIF